MRSWPITCSSSSVAGPGLKPSKTASIPVTYGWRSVVTSTFRARGGDGHAVGPRAEESRGPVDAVGQVEQALSADLSRGADPGDHAVDVGTKVVVPVMVLRMCTGECRIV